MRLSHAKIVTRKSVLGEQSVEELRLWNLYFELRETDCDFPGLGEHYSASASTAVPKRISLCMQCSVVEGRERFTKL